jgi:hypothetical protein
MSWRELNAASDAEERIPAVAEERHQLLLHCYRTGHGPVSSGERRQLAELAGELSRLHREVSDYYRQVADRDHEGS